MLRTAPHLVQRLPLVVPLMHWWQIPRVWIGVKMYDLLSGRESIGSSEYLSVADTIKRVPSLCGSTIAGSILMWEGFCVHLFALVAVL